MIALRFHNSGQIVADRGSLHALGFARGGLPRHKVSIKRPTGSGSIFTASRSVEGWNDGLSWSGRGMNSGRWGGTMDNHNKTSFIKNHIFFNLLRMKLKM